MYPSTQILVWGLPSNGFTITCEDPNIITLLWTTFWEGRDFCFPSIQNQFIFTTNRVYKSVAMAGSIKFPKFRINIIASLPGGVPKLKPKGGMDFPLSE